MGQPGVGADGCSGVESVELMACHYNIFAGALVGGSRGSCRSLRDVLRLRVWRLEAASTTLSMGQPYNQPKSQDFRGVLQLESTGLAAGSCQTSERFSDFVERGRSNRVANDVRL